MLESVVNDLLDEVMGFVVDPEQLDLNIELTPGSEAITGHTNIILDYLDGQQGNDLPAVAIDFSIGFDGHVSGTANVNGTLAQIGDMRLLVDQLVWDDTEIRAVSPRLSLRCLRSGGNDWLRSTGVGKRSYRSGRARSESGSCGSRRIRVEC
jgi:hypothetical protein